MNSLFFYALVFFLLEIIKKKAMEKIPWHFRRAFGKQAYNSLRRKCNGETKITKKEKKKKKEIQKSKRVHLDLSFKSLKGNVIW